MEGNVLLSWRFQNIAFIVVVVLGMALIIGGLGYAVKNFQGGSDAAFS